MTVAKKNKYEMHFGKEWAQFLDPFLSSIEYARIGVELTRQMKEGIEITPGFGNIFRAFKECPWDKVHSVILGQDVYPGRNKDKTLIADGIAFSAKENATPPKSLNGILEAIDQQVFDGEYTLTTVMNYDRMEPTWDLKRWSNQGILLINCALTTVVSQPGAHLTLWQPFTKYVLEMLNERKDSLGIVLMGSHARAYKSLFKNETHCILECEHPAAALYKKRKWDSNNVFCDLTDFQSRVNNIRINW